MNKRPRKIFVFIIARTSNPLDNFEAKICVMLIVMIIKIKNDSREKNPNELVITKNQKVNPAVTAIALNRGEESSILNWVNEGYQSTLCQCCNSN